MKHPRLWSVLCLMTVCYQLGMSSNRYDGLFGQCQDASVRERVLYDVTVPVLQRLQEVLKQLMMQGLSWQDEITQYIISQEMNRVPRTYSPTFPKEAYLEQSTKPAESSGKLSYSSSRSRSGPDRLTPALMQRYLDYMVLSDQPQASLRMQAPLIDPYTYPQFGYQEEERLASSLGAGYPRTPQRSGGARPSDRDRQLLQDLLSLYLSAGQPPREKETASSLYHEEPDFPLAYSQDYDQASEREAQNKQKKIPRGPSTLPPKDDATQKKLGAMLGKYGIDVNDLSAQQLNSLTSTLKLLQNNLQDQTDLLEDNIISKKKPELSEGDMTHLGERESDRFEKLPVPQLEPQPAATGVPITPSGIMGASSVGEGASVSIEGVEVIKKSSKAPSLNVAATPSHTKEEYGYIVTNQKPLSLFDGVRLLETLAEKIHLTTSSFINISVVGPALTFRLRQNNQNLSADDVADKAVAEKTFLESETGLKILQTGVGERSDGQGVPHAMRVRDASRWVFLTLVGVACVGGVVIAALTIACLRHHSRQLSSGKLGLGPEGGSDTHFEYQELCRQHMAAKTSFSRQEAGGTDTSRVSSVSSQFSDVPQASPSSHSSTPSWCEEPAQSNMDISTGHMILAYMEDHLKNKDRLLKEWEALCSYQAEPSACSVAQSETNVKKNRNPDFVPYDHSRVKLKADINPSRTDYINASTIIEHDPRMPAYIATQGPLSHTIADFWQMVWENGCTVIVMMSALVEDGEKQCDRYWPDEGSSLYHIYEVNLVSEHIWCNDFLVRSFYLKNVQSQETRTLTQFHFLSWPAQGIPTSTRPLLDFRRKVNKCYRGRSCPIIVHCSDGTGRTGTYILIDMVLNRMAKGVKEIDIAATLEHIRDQRPGMVRTKDQFEFALTAVAEEVNAILKALPQ
ncbi:receptor-type tyrosine-protein phosphatase-like N isoform X2 [Amia ocellicauda]|uniref:receptor-type tyrosine-protein phosphatase-like N isoform X2 n=1 Tax=Amia ocellicauda TaxID=2972642 RepID=UPI0034648B7F